MNLHFRDTRKIDPAQKRPTAAREVNPLHRDARFGAPRLGAGQRDAHYDEEKLVSQIILDAVADGGLIPRAARNSSLAELINPMGREAMFFPPLGWFGARCPPPRFRHATFPK